MRQGWAAVALVAAAAISPAHAQDPSAKSLERGKQVFMQAAQPACAVCHTLEAAGAEGTIGPSLDELKPDAARVQQAVLKGLGVMPPFAGKLSPEDIEAVSQYVAKSVGR